MGHHPEPPADVPVHATCVRCRPFCGGRLSVADFAVKSAICHPLGVGLGAAATTHRGRVAPRMAELLMNSAVADIAAVVSRQ